MARITLGQLGAIGQMGFLMPKSGLAWFTGYRKIVVKDRWECTFCFEKCTYRAPAKIQLDNWNLKDDLFTDFILPCEDMKELSKHLNSTAWSFTSSRLAPVLTGILENDVERYDIRKMTPMRLESGGDFFRMFWKCRGVTLMEK